MALAATERRYTPEELLALPDGEHFELVDGQLLEKPMGAESAWTTCQLSRWLGNYCEEHGLGHVFSPEMGYRCFELERNRVRKPDVSFVRLARLPENWRRCGFFTFPPDLAVEVISPNDLFTGVRTKVGEYLEAGVPLVWVIDPQSRTVEIHRADGSATFLDTRGELSGEEVLPGFVCALRELFAPA